MKIRLAVNEDLPEIIRMASILYRTPEEELEQEMQDLSEDEKQVFFVIEADSLVGFINGSIRVDYVEGSSQSPTGYIEGIYIEEKYRKQGLAKELVDYVAGWAKKKGCVELASDVEDFNHTSIAFHKAIGLEEVNRIVCFIKKI
jgi:aminoglycoside 6'-N-acetyltransferase I